ATQARHAVQLACQFTLDIANREKKTPLLALQEIEALVGSDAIDPREEPGVFPEAVDVAVYLDKYFLGDVVGIVVVDYHFPHMPIHFLLLRAYPQVEAVIPRFRVTDLFQ